MEKGWKGVPLSRFFSTSSSGRKHKDWSLPASAGAPSEKDARRVLFSGKNIDEEHTDSVSSSSSSAEQGEGAEEKKTKKAKKKNKNEKRILGAEPQSSAENVLFFFHQIQESKMEVVLGLLFLMILMIGTYFVLFTLSVERGWFRWSRQRRLSDIALPGPWRNRKWTHWFLLSTRTFSFLYACGIWTGAIIPSLSSQTDLFAFYTIW
jgi:hypothetical protein